MSHPSPVIITPRLLWGVPLHTVPGPSWISVDVGKPGQYGRCGAAYYIDTPEWEYSNDDISGLGGPVDFLENLLCFLSAAAEAYRYTMGGRDSDNSDLFPPHIMEWAYLNDDELSMAQLDLTQETPND